jgi:hypothetical protein
MRRKATVWRMACASPWTFRPLTRYGPDLILLGSGQALERH